MNAIGIFFGGFLGGIGDIFSASPLIIAGILIVGGIIKRIPWLVVAPAVLACGLVGGYFSGYNSGVKTEAAKWEVQVAGLRAANAVKLRRIDEATRAAAIRLQQLRLKHAEADGERAEQIRTELEAELNATADEGEPSAEPTTLTCPEVENAQPQKLECPPCKLCRRSLGSRPPDSLLRIIEKR